MNSQLVLKGQKGTSTDKKMFFEKYQIAGGVLSFVYIFQPLKTKVDFVFHGGTETSLSSCLKSIVHGKDCFDTQEISHL